MPFQWPSAQVPEWPSALGVPECLKCRVAECPSALQMPEYLKCLSVLSARVSFVPCESKCVSKSVTQSPSQSAFLQGWFSKLISTLRANTLRQDLILRLRKLDLISNSSLIKLTSLNELRNMYYHCPLNMFSRV